MKAFAEKHETDLLSFAPIQETNLNPFRAQSELGFRKVHVARFSPWRLGLREFRLSLRGLLPGCSVPVILSRYSAPRVIEPAREWMSAQGPWDIAIVDGVFGAGLFLQERKLVRPETVKRIAYRANRMEFEKWTGEFEKARLRGSPYRAYSLGAQAHAMKNFERALLDLSEFAFCSSTQDLAQLEKSSSGPRYVLTSVEEGAETVAKRMAECLVQE